MCIRDSVAPEDGHDILRGLDIGNLSSLAQTMQKTYQRREPVLSPVFTFTGIEDPLMTALYYVDDPEGFAAALLDPQQVVEVLLDGRPSGLVARLTDGQSGASLLEEAGFDASASERFTLNVGSRTLILDVSSSPDYAPTQMQLAVPAGLAGGGITLLMLALSLVGGGRRTSS